MAHLLRGKQAGVQGDLSAGLTAESFNIDDINRFGINSQISQIAYDPVQSLVAVGTNDTKFGPGQVYVFGQKRVNAVLPLAHKASVKILQFCADKLLVLDSKNDLTIFSLETRRILNSFSPPRTVTAVHSDPTLDYVLLGMQNGDIMAYDLDREGLAPFRIPNFWKEQDRRAKIVPVITLALHPRDIGTLLIGYYDGAVIYSFKQNKPLKFFQYQLPRGAPGGDADPGAMNVNRSPRLSHAVWHPTGTFILTGHEDGSLVFWDAKDGRIVMARSLTDTNIDKPGAGGAMSAMSPVSPISPGAGGAFAVKEPLQKIVWCANQDPDDTAILISGGASTTVPSKGLTLFELGRTPNYATSSWQALAQHFESPKRQRMLPTPPGAEVMNFCLIPRSSPHFAGAQDPIAMIALLSSGELISLSFPSGLPITPTNQLHVSMTFVHPFINRINLSPMDRTRWLGMTESRTQGPQILKGGSPAQLPLKRFEHRNIFQTAHADGTVRLWDAGHGDELENDAVLQADVSRAVGRHNDIELTNLSLSGATGEFAVGLRSGEVIVFRWGHNKNTGRDPPASLPNSKRNLTNITDRRDPGLAEGLFPFTLLDEQNGPVTAVKISDVGFLAAGFEGGSLVVIDLRGPAIIYRGSTSEFAGPQKRGGTLRRGSMQSPTQREWATALEFSVMTADADSYSSIMLHVGTSGGNLSTFKLLPEQSGRYTVELAGSIALDDSRVIRVAPLDAATGGPAFATQDAVAGLRNGRKTNGVLLAVTQTGARLFKPSSHKGAHKGWDNVFCHSAAVTMIDDRNSNDVAYALVCLFGDGTSRAYSIPALREIGGARIDSIFDVRRLSDAVVTGTGDVIGWTGPSEVALINVWGMGLNLNRSKDTLFNPEILIPPRPTISNVQWLSGTQYVTPADMDILIGGPDRPPSKRMIMQAQSDAVAARQAGRSNTSASSSTAGTSQESYWDYMTRQINERTEKLGIMGDSVDNLQQNAASWSDDVGKFVAKQKRNLVFGAVKGKFGM